LRIAFDPAPEKRVGNCFALAEMELKSGRVTVIVQDAGWDLGAPRYSPDGDRIAFIASHQGVKHTMPGQLAVWQRDGGRSRSTRWSCKLSGQTQKR